MISFSDYIFHRLAALDVSKVFGVSGGGIMHLTDAISRHKTIKFHSFHHESHAGYAADALSKLEVSLSCVLSTTGPGAANVIPSVIAAYQDSSPVLFLTGQCKLSDSTLFNEVPYLRSLGPAEFDIVTASHSYTKFSKLVTDPITGIDDLENAIVECLSNRPGPCLLDIPLDIQGSRIDETLLNRIDDFNVELAELLTASKKSKHFAAFPKALSETDFFNELKSARKPLLMLGAGIEKEPLLASNFIEFLRQSSIPYVCTSSCKSLSILSHKNYLGNPGIRGNRSANIAIDQCDVLVVVSSSLHPQVTGWDPSRFAPNAKIFLFDVDKDQLNYKSSVFKVDKSFCLYASSAFSLVKSVWGGKFDWSNISAWLDYLSYLRSDFLCEYCYDNSSSMPSYYHVVRKLNSILNNSAEFSCVISDAGSSWYVVGQSLQTNSSCQLITSASLGGMGYALPALIGVSLSKNKPAIAVTGDGSLQMCSQELPTFAALTCPSIILLVNNSGYMSIRNTQNKFCSGRLIGTDSTNDVFLPSFEKLSACYGINYLAVRSTKELDGLSGLDFKSPTIVEVFSQPNESLLPAAGSKLDESTGKFYFAGLSNMTPVVSYLSYDDYIPRNSA